MEDIQFALCCYGFLDMDYIDSFNSALAVCLWTRFEYLIKIVKPDVALHMK